MKASLRESFDDFMRANYDKMYQYAYLTLLNKDDAAEVVQSAAEKVYVKWSRTVSRLSPQQQVAYFSTTVSNLMNNLFTRLIAKERLQAEFLERPCTSKELATSDLQDALRRALAQLPIRQREVIVLRHYFDLSVAEVADRLNMPTGTVKSHTSRGLALLKAYLGEPLTSFTEVENS